MFKFALKWIGEIFNSATLLPHILRAENFDMYYWHLGDDEHVCEAGWQLGTLM